MNPIFPASYSTLASGALANLVTEKYGIQQADCKFFIRGVGDTYMLTTPDSRYVLRVYRQGFRSYAQVVSEMELLQASKAAGVSVSVPVADLSGEVVQRVQAMEGERYVVLFTYAPGAPPKVLNERQLRMVGREMAKFHNVSSEVKLSDPRWTYDTATTLDEPIRRIRDAAAADPEGYEWLQSAAATVKEKLAHVDDSKFSKGYCHYDFLPKNFHVEGDDALTFFDFDFIGYGWLVNDLMSLWQHFCFETLIIGNMKQEDADRDFAILVEGYRELRPLSDEELAVMPWLGLGWWVFYLGFYTTHDQFYPILQPLAIKGRIGLMRRFFERYCR